MGKKDVDVGEIRRAVLLEFAKELGCPEKDIATLRKAVDARIASHLHTLQCGVQQERTRGRNHCTLMSLNVRSLRNKLTSNNGIELWSYAKQQRVEGLCIQDHKMWDRESPRIQAAARAIIPNMGDSSLSIHQGLT